MRIDDATIKVLTASIKMREMRQEIITSNIANADTPGYKAKRLGFEDALARALDVDGEQGLRTSDDEHYDVGSGGFANLQPEIYEDPNGNASEDGNTVDRDHEMAQMAKNKILYDASIQLLNKKLGLMKYAISADR